MTDNVVFLSFVNKKGQPEEVRESPDTITVLACTECHNKTYLIVHDDATKFPYLQCCCCGARIGRFGWTPDD